MPLTKLQTLVSLLSTVDGCHAVFRWRCAAGVVLVLLPLALAQ